MAHFADSEADVVHSVDAKAQKQMEFFPGRVEILGLFADAAEYGLWLVKRHKGPEGIGVAVGTKSVRRAQRQRQFRHSFEQLVASFPTEQTVVAVEMVDVKTENGISPAATRGKPLEHALAECGKRHQPRQWIHLQAQRARRHMRQSVRFLLALLGGVHIRVGFVQQLADGRAAGAGIHGETNGRIDGATAAPVMTIDRALQGVPRLRCARLVRAFHHHHEFIPAIAVDFPIAAKGLAQHFH